MKPEDLAKSGTESGHQRAVFAWAALNANRFPELKWLFHIPNGGSRGDDSKSRMIRGANLKAEGVKKGPSDLCLPVKRGGYSGLYIEMKKPNEKATKEQLEFGDFVLSQGYGFYVADHWEKAVKVIEGYLSQ